MWKKLLCEPATWEQPRTLFLGTLSLAKDTYSKLIISAFYSCLWQPLKPSTQKIMTILPRASFKWCGSAALAVKLLRMNSPTAQMPSLRNGATVYMSALPHASLKNIFSTGGLDCKPCCTSARITTDAANLRLVVCSESHDYQRNYLQWPSFFKWWSYLSFQYLTHRREIFSVWICCKNRRRQLPLRNE